MASATWGRPSTGPFVLPARLVLAIGGIIAVGLAAFNLFHEFRATEVDALYTAIASLVLLAWLGAIGLAYRGGRVGVFVTAFIAFVEFGVIASSHFVAGTAAVSSFVAKEGLPVATADMALIPACMLVVMSAAVCWSTPRGRNRRLDLLPLFLTAVVGTVLVLLQATDDLHRKDLGNATPEDGAFAAAVLASIWLAGGLWISRVRKTGSLLIAIGTFGVWYSFVTLHLVKGGTSVSQIVSASGAVWAWVGSAAALLAAASFLLSIGLFVESLIRRRAKPTTAKQPVRRRA